MSKIYHIEASERLFYEFWVRADSLEEAEDAVINLGAEQLQQGITDAEDFEMRVEADYEEEELYGWVKNKIINAKDVLDE